MKKHGVCLVTGCIQTEFEAAPTAALPDKPTSQITLFYKTPDVPPHQVLGTITADSTSEKYGQDAVAEIKKLGLRLGGDGLILPESMEGCGAPEPIAQRTCGLRIPLRATLIKFR